MNLKIGSLFDGSGGFPLAATMCGIEPVWASEIEPYPIAVTRSRFPNMKHLGSVTDVKGNEVEPVDVITFGSPCQDLSVAGKRAGLKHTENGDDETTRSGLFMEAIRIIKEMREATNGEYPRFAVWENVPGAFSSNKGQDFRVVLEELVRIAEPTAVMPPVPKGGWAYADVYCGNGWSLAYRVLDAQYWGVPQRRRRIYLVADFGGQRAGKILFEREGLRGDFETCGASWQATAGDAEDGVGAGDREGIGLDIYNLAVTGDVAASLTTATGQGASNTGPSVAVPYTLKIRSECVAISSKQQSLVTSEGAANTLGANDYKEPQAVATLEPVVGVYKADDGSTGKASPTLVGDHNNRVTDHSALVVCREVVSEPINVHGENISGTLLSRDYKGPGRWDSLDKVVAIDRAFFNQGQNAQYAQYDPQFYIDGTCPTLVARGPSAVAVRYIVRRLTPTECARLQGFPDAWGHPDQKHKLTDEEYRFWLEVRNTHADINGKAVKDYTKAQMLTWYNKLHTDSAEYKLWGNGIALPCALYVMQGIAEVLHEN